MVRTEYSGGSTEQIKPMEKLGDWTTLQQTGRAAVGPEVDHKQAVEHMHHDVIQLADIVVF